MSTNSSLKRSDIRKNNLRNIILTGMLLAILIVQEQLLIFLPNIQLSVVIILVYAAILPGYLLGFLVVSYVLIDNMIMGSLSLIYTAPMLLGWGLLAVVGKLIKNRSMIVVLLVALLFGFIYGWMFIPFNMIVHGLNIFWPYFMADLPFEIVMAVNNYFTVLLLYKPLVLLLRPLANPEFSVAGTDTSSIDEADIPENTQN